MPKIQTLISNFTALVSNAKSNEIPHCSNISIDHTWLPWTMVYQDPKGQELCKGQQTASDANSYESPSSTPMLNAHTLHFHHAKQPEIYYYNAFWNHVHCFKKQDKQKQMTQIEDTQKQCGEQLQEPANVHPGWNRSAPTEHWPPSQSSRADFAGEDRTQAS